MQASEDRDATARTRAALVDATTMSIVWMNEAAREDLVDLGSDSLAAVPLERVAPMGPALGIVDALQRAAQTGASQRLQADLVSTSRGSMTAVTSVEPLPGGMLLVLTENTWKAGRAAGDTDASRRPRRGSR